MGQGALVLLFIALTGYAFLSQFSLTKFRIYKYQGHHLVYKCCVYGLAFVIVSSLIFVLTWPITKQSSFLFNAASVIFPTITQSQFNVHSILLMALLVSMLSAWCMNEVLTEYYKKEILKQDQTLKIIEEGQIATNMIGYITESEIHQDFQQFSYRISTDNKYIEHILNACRDGQMLMITMSNNKCYVCIPYGFDTPKDNEEQKEVVVLPVASGFRHSDDKCFEITTYYREVIDAINQDSRGLSDDDLKTIEERLESYVLTISFSQIVSICNFDLSKYLKFKEAENKRRNEIKRGRGDDKTKTNLSFRHRFIGKN